MSSPENYEITPEEVASRLQRGDGLVLLDCREPEEWQQARIDGALLIPMGDVPGRLTELDPEQPTIIYCHHGIRSRSVAHFLAQQDFDEVRSMTGGIDAWSRTIDPTVPRYG